jgi:hypothetical protein
MRAAPARGHRTGEQILEMPDIASRVIETRPVAPGVRIEIGMNTTEKQPQIAPEHRPAPGE